MRRYMFLLLTGILLSFSSAAQSYQPFPAGDASWKVIRCFSFFPAGWYDVFTYSMSGDTMMNGISYKKIFETVHHLPGTPYDTLYTHFFGALREQEKQIRMVSEWTTGDTSERILYDFSVEEENEWIYSNLLTYGDPITIKSRSGIIDSVEIAGIFHRRIQILNADGNATGESWIEGIGSVFGLVYSGFYMITDNSYDLRCFSTPTAEFVNNDLNLGFCLSNPQVECEFATGTPVVSTKIPYLIYPNPVSERLLLTIQDPAADISSLTLFELTGKQVLHHPISGKQHVELNVASMPHGMYILKIEESSGNSTTWPLVIQ